MRGPAGTPPPPGYTAHGHSQLVKTGDSLDDKPNQMRFLRNPLPIRYGRLFRLIHLDTDGCADPHPLRRKRSGSTAAAVPLLPRQELVQSAVCGLSLGRLPQSTNCDCVSARWRFRIRCPTKARSSSRQYFALLCQERCRPIAMDTTFSQSLNRRHLRPMPPSR